MTDQNENSCPRLIEVALPIREISAESVRDKNIHHAHISHLHTWWARRPLAAARAVVFASLVPDPDDPLCAPDFRRAVEKYLKTEVPAELRTYNRGRQEFHDPDPYHPYKDIPDTLRNRLLAFIAKWSPEALDFETGKTGQPPSPNRLLDDRSLAKWETSDPENARGREILRVAQSLVHAAYPAGEPTVLDPFAGGGSIPLEATRLGCQTIANDYNPVAYLILRATCEYPQKFGIPGKRKVTRHNLGNSAETEIAVPNVLIHDVSKWAHHILEGTRKQIGYLYPVGKDELQTLTYLWARTVPCSNPSCRGEIPLLRSLQLRTGMPRTALKANVDKKQKVVRFSIVHGDAVRDTEGTKRQRGPAICPFCGQANEENELRRAATAGRMGQRMIGVIVGKPREKIYRPVEPSDIEAVDAAKALQITVPTEYIVPEINSPTASPKAGAHRSINLELYGFKRWGQLFSHRQLVLMFQLVEQFHAAAAEIRAELSSAPYRSAVLSYLALWIDRIAAFNNTMCRWAPGSEIVKTPFSGQSVPMMWDYPEVSPFSDGSGTPITQLGYMLDVLEHERATNKFPRTPTVLLASATSLPMDDSSCDCVVTDPPYGNSIAYADLSDFFYVWLKRTLSELEPESFKTPQTPKEEEATSHKHRHQGSQEHGNAHYRKILKQSFEEAKRVAKSPKLITVMFAHQSTDAWVALISALLDAGLSPQATWPIATEMPNTALALGTASLETSVTVACRPRDPRQRRLFQDGSHGSQQGRSRLGCALLDIWIARRRLDCCLLRTGGGRLWKI